MPIHNTDIAEIFNKMADLLEIEGANQFRVRAYRNAARTVASHGKNVADLVKEDKDISKLPGIGKSMVEKIKEIADTGTLSQLKELEERVPPELSGLMNVSGLGPKKVQALYRELGVETLDDLRQAAEKKKIRELEGFGKKTEEKILREAKKADHQEKRFKLITVEEQVNSLENYLKKVKKVKKAIVAGSYRRRKETVGDLDILATCKRGSKAMDRFVAYEDVDQVISKGKTRSSVVLRSGLQVDLRVVPQVSYGAALHYFTGSKEHNIAVRKLGQQKNLKINEYGVFKGKKRIAGKTEKEVYEKVNLTYIEPELRENRGEIEAAKKKKLPALVSLEDIRGDLHAHTKETDGHHTLEEMAEAARNRGYEYLAISDHSQKVTMAKGLDAKRLAKEIENIDRLNEKLKDLVVLKSIEVDILKDGSLDLPDDILKELDFTVCSVHYNLNLSEEKQTERIIRAMDNPFFHILGHPSGRLINEREPYEVDMERLMDAAKERGCFMELNAHPDRLDLTDVSCKMAKDKGVKVVVSTDAHSITDLEFMRFGVWQARRGWLESDDVLNTRSWDEIKKMLKRS
jgi:DNA polymerase (family 10)